MHQCIEKGQKGKILLPKTFLYHTLSPHNLKKIQGKGHSVIFSRVDKFHMDKNCLPLSYPPIKNIFKRKQSFLSIAFLVEINQSKIAWSY